MPSADIGFEFGVVSELEYQRRCSIESVLEERALEKGLPQIVADM